ncbi:hypothetical protein [Paenibacillus wulumuqiensis]|uniref:hypothetical protein n=1 Tax=Paenibacillus wulumuqiensis TaxID=1567107 RepID=UPI00061968FF|nr:hypothetical protein [Paenibacillus wulumuqiensis]
MKISIKILMLLVGVYLIFQGIDILTTTARGESIYRVGILIPAQDRSLSIYGSTFLFIGALLISIPFLSKFVFKFWSRSF